MALTPTIGEGDGTGDGVPVGEAVADEEGAKDDISRTEGDGPGPQDHSPRAATRPTTSKGQDDHGVVVPRTILGDPRILLPSIRVAESQSTDWWDAPAPGIVLAAAASSHSFRYVRSRS